MFTILTFMTFMTIIDNCLPNNKTTTTKTMTKIILGLVTFETLITILTIENLTS